MKTSIVISLLVLFVFLYGLNASIGASAFLDADPLSSEVNKQSDLQQENSQHKKPQECKGGCAAAPQPKENISLLRMQELLNQFSSVEENASAEAFDELLFYSSSVGQNITKLNLDSLQRIDQELLLSEIEKQHVEMTFKIVDASGELRLLTKQVVPLSEKQHLHPEVDSDLNSPELSFTIKRVGQKHLWSRL